MPKSSQLNIETTQGDFFALWIHSLTGTKVLGGCQLESCHCCALTDHFSSGCSPFFSAGSILQGPDLPWVESMVPFYLHCRWLPWSVELQLLCSPCHHFTAVSRVREEVGDCLLVDVAYCCSHVAALSYSLSWWRCFQPCSYGPALPVTSSSGIFSRLLLSWTFLFWGWSSWTLGSLLERAPKFFLLHCSPHPTLPSSCADAKDFRLNTSASQNCDGCS